MNPVLLVTENDESLISMDHPNLVNILPFITRYKNLWTTRTLPIFHHLLHGTKADSSYVELKCNVCFRGP